jgi:hypothetical protein
MPIQRLHLPLVAPVCGKRRFYVREAADEFRVRLEFEESLLPRPLKPGKLATYHCKVCECYHVGHRRDVPDRC